jgi:hypothetical protein
MKMVIDFPVRYENVYQRVLKTQLHMFLIQSLSTIPLAIKTVVYEHFHASIVGTHDHVPGIKHIRFIPKSQACPPFILLG